MISTSPTVVLKLEPELRIVIVLPVEFVVTFPAPAMTLQIVELPPVEVKTTEVG